MLIDAQRTNLGVRALLVVLASAVHCSAAHAASPGKDIKEGNRLFREGAYEASREKYDDALKKAPESDVVNFNLGTALYKEGKFDDAIEHLQKVLLTEDDALKQSAHYNLGNALYQAGMSRSGENIDAAIQSLEKAIGQYERALSLRADDDDAQHNYEFVKKELARLKIVKQQQQSQSCPYPKDKKDQQQDQQQQGQQDQQQQGQQDQQQQDQQQQGQDQQQKQEEGQEQENAPAQEKQEEGQNSPQERGQEGQEDYNDKEAGAQEQDTRELTPQEAQMMLESYQQAEEPQGLLNVNQRVRDRTPVYKDW